jgi:hypothetical protein
LANSESDCEEPEEGGSGHLTEHGGDYGGLLLGWGQIKFLDPAGAVDPAEVPSKVYYI